LLPQITLDNCVAPHLEMLAYCRGRSAFKLRNALLSGVIWGL
jgi:hypothetical protein